MKNLKPSITITTALAVLVVVLFAGIPFSDASQALIKHGVKGKHKHAAHKLAVKHSKAPSQTLAKSEAEKEHGETTPANDSLWFLQHEDPATGTIPTGLYNTWYNSDHAMTYSGRDGILGNTGKSPLDTVASLGPFQGGYNFQHGDITQEGRTRALLVSSASNSIFFAGCVSGGLWKSTNAGSSWAPINDTAACLNVSCITQSPFNSNVIYYGTGEAVGLYSGNGGAGVFKSTNGGTTFQQLSATTSMGSSSAIEHDKTDSLTVYYGTQSNGLQRTTNGGTTWSTATGTSGYVCDIVTFPRVGQSLNDNVLIAKYGSGLYMATNGKTGSFTQISSAAFPTAGNIYRIKLAYCKNFPNIVYAAFDATNDWWSSPLSGFCKSSDGGVTWTARTIPSNFSSCGDVPMLLGVCPFDSNKILLGGVWPTCSTDGGASWNANSNYYMHADMHAVASFNSGSHEFLVGSDGGVEHRNWDTINGQGWWTLNHNYVTTQFYGGDFGSFGRRCAGGTQDNGSWRISPSDSGGFSEMGGYDGALARISQQDSIPIAYVNTQFDIYKVSNFWTSNWGYGHIITPNTGQGGASWYPLYWGNHADGLQLYFLTNQGVWRTVDSGNHWTQLNTDTIAGIQKVGVTNATNPSVYFDGHVGSTGHFYRIDNAATFTPGTPVDLSASLPDGDYMGEITPSPTNVSELYIGITNYTSNPRAYKVMNANTATPHWVNITGNLPPYISVNQIQADPDDTTSLLAATSFGLYFSGDMGAHWYKESRVPNVSINQMQLRTSDRRLFLFTYGRGVWYCSLLAPSSKRTTTITPTETTEQLQFSLYPNPATEKLTVSPEQELSSSARIAIYSSDGWMISESTWNPTDGQKQEVNINALPSGAYFLQITDGNKIAKKKFVKM